MKKLWGGAFQEDSDRLVDRFGQSIASDLRFWQEDLIGSVAHARMLGATGIIGRDEAELIIKALERIHEEGPQALPMDVEDIHTAIEVRLHDLIGELAGKLHTARSRNDQVATDTRLYLHNELLVVLELIKALQATLLQLGRKHKSSLMPGYTHHQPAQPITLGYHLMAHFWAMQRHGWRVERLFEAANYSPLGAAALAGTSFPIDRHMTAAELGFTAPIPNGLDATSDRSFILDTLHNCALIMLDLSRISQELVLWSTVEFGFVRLSDRVTTGSSIMPQKRNPDMAELIRGRTGRTIGHWTAFASTMKALPLGYHRDTQDDKPPLFDALDLSQDSLRLVTAMLESATWNLKAMAHGAMRGFSTATDLADFLTRHGIPFRRAHEIVGHLVRGAATDAATGMMTVSREAMAAAVGEALADEAMQMMDAGESVRRRETYGGPGPNAMAEQLRHAARLHRKRGFLSIS